jgi:hypothetical protein
MDKLNKKALRDALRHIEQKFGKRVRNLSEKGFYIYLRHFTRVCKMSEREAVSYALSMFDPYTISMIHESYATRDTEGASES